MCIPQIGGRCVARLPAWLAAILPPVSDGRRRQLERAVEAGDAEAEAALFAQHLRLGVLGVEKVRAAAFLGSAAAAEVLRGQALEVPSRESVGFDHLGAHVSLARGVFLSRLFLPFWRARPLGGRPDDVARALEAMLACPCPGHARECALAQEAVKRVVDAPDLSQGYDGPPPIPPLWADVEGTLAVAGARCAEWTAWLMARSLTFSATTTVGGSFDAAWSASVAQASHAAIEELQTRALATWSRTDGFDGVLRLAEDAALRARLLAELRAEIDSGERDPSVLAVREAERARRARTTRHAGLFRVVPPPPPDSVTTRYAAFFMPAFDPPLCVALDVSQLEPRGSITVAGYEDSILDALLDDGVEPPSSWSVGRTLGPADLAWATTVLGPLDPANLDDEEVNGRDGLTAVGEVVPSAGVRSTFTTWCPWDHASDAHVQFFDLLLDLARRCADDARVADLLENVEQYRRRD